MTVSPALEAGHTLWPSLHLLLPRDGDQRLVLTNRCTFFARTLIWTPLTLFPTLNRPSTSWPAIPLVLNRLNFPAFLHESLELFNSQRPHCLLDFVPQPIQEA